MVQKALNNVFLEVFKGNLDYILGLIYTFICVSAVIWLFFNEHKQGKEMQEAQELYRMKLDGLEKLMKKRSDENAGKK